MTSLFLYARRADGILLLEVFIACGSFLGVVEVFVLPETCSFFDRMKMAESALLLSLCRLAAFHQGIDQSRIMICKMIREPSPSAFLPEVKPTGLVEAMSVCVCLSVSFCYQRRLESG